MSEPEGIFKRAPAGEADPKIVEMLENVLADARAGRVRAAFVAVCLSDQTVATTFNDGGVWALLAAAVESGKHELLMIQERERQMRIMKGMN